MFDLSQPAREPGKCPKCHGSGVYSWGATINGVPQHSGRCNSCSGKGEQTPYDIKRNMAYNRHKLATTIGI